jgi:hypothetical protein
MVQRQKQKRERSNRSKSEVQKLQYDNKRRVCREGTGAKAEADGATGNRFRCKKEVITRAQKKKGW